MFSVSGSTSTIIGSRTNVLDDVHRCRESHRRGNHFVAGSDARCDQCRVQSGSAGIEWQSVYRAEISSELSRELLGLRAGGDPVRPQRVYDRCYLFFAD